MLVPYSGEGKNRVILTGINPMLVPYSGEGKLFDELVTQAHTKGISPQWVKSAAPITVSCYREDKLLDIAEQCVMFYTIS